MKPLAAAASAALLLAACAPVISGSEPVFLPRALADAARVGTITLSTGWVRTEDDFGDTFVEEVREELSRCATGSHALDLRLHVDEVRRAGRVQTVLTGEGMHSVAAVAEFVEPATGEVVGRFPLEVGTQAGGRVAGLLGDRQMMVSEEFGRALCLEAFGRNPRGPSITRATRG